MLLTAKDFIKRSDENICSVGKMLMPINYRMVKYFKRLSGGFVYHGSSDVSIFPPHNSPILSQIVK